MTTLWLFLRENFGIGYTVAIVSMGALVIGFVTGVLSVLFVSQKKSIIGDTISHTTLPGILIGFLLVLEKIRIYLILGGLLSAILSVFVINFILSKSNLKPDVAIAISLSFFVGIGIALLSYVQRQSISSQAGLTHYLIGNISFLQIQDLQLFIFLASLVLIVVFFFYKEFKVMIFDKEFAFVSGIPVKGLDTLLLVLISMVVVLAVESIGVVLVAGLLISPAVAARQWSNKFHMNMIIAGFIGSFSSFSGVIASSRMENTPPGPAIIVILSAVTLFSVVFGSRNGLLIGYVHTMLLHRRVDHAKVLADFIAATNGLFRIEGPTLLEFNKDEFPNLDNELIDTLCQCGYCHKLTATKYCMTYKGVNAVRSALME